MTNLEQAGKDFLAEITPLESLAPSKKVNDIFHRFCTICIQSDETPNDEGLIKQCSDACAQAEVAMEIYWAKKIIAAETPQAMLESFWYYRNYEQLGELEYINAKYFCTKIQHVLFLGSGPLPLTAILLAQRGIQITLVDYDQTAVQISKQLIQALNLSEKITVIHADASDFSSTTDFDIVYGASLLFQSEENTHLLKNISNLSAKYFLLRTSYKGRKLLYKPIPEQIIQKYFSPQLLCHPKNNIVNSFIIVTKK